MDGEFGQGMGKWALLAHGYAGKRTARLSGWVEMELKLDAACGSITAEAELSRSGDGEEICRIVGIQKPAEVYPSGGGRIFLIQSGVFCMMGRSGNEMEKMHGLGGGSYLESSSVDGDAAVPSGGEEREMMRHNFLRRRFCISGQVPV